MRWRGATAFAVLWLSISMTVSAQTLSDENPGSGTGQTAVTAYISDAPEEPPENGGERDAGAGGAQTGDHAKSLTRLLLLCSGALFAAAAVTVRKELKESEGMENNIDDENDKQETDKD